jgi:hydroxymethylbilane synthase
MRLIFKGLGYRFSPATAICHQKTCFHRMRLHMFLHLCSMTVFISRLLPDTSIFKQKMAEAGIETTGLPLIQLSPLPVFSIPTCDWIFFSSQNAVSFFFKKIAPLPAIRWAAMGAGTAKALEQQGIRPAFIGVGDPEATAALFEPLAVGQTVVFPGARTSQGGVKRYLPPSITIIPVAVYHNQPVLNPPLRTEQVLVFTSPMNVEAYFEAHSLLDYQQVIAIGKTTFSALQACAIPRAIVANQPTEASMADAVLQLLGTKNGF